MKNISIIGAGYVGLVNGVCLAELGHKVVCHDIDPRKLGSLKKGEVPFYEPDLTGLLKKNFDEGQIVFSGDLEQSINQAEVIYICVGTPPKKDGSADMTAYYDVIRNIIKYFRAKASSNESNFVVIVNKSTVPIGTARTVNDMMSKSLPKDQFTVVSNPEFLREGKAVGDFMNPERIVVGFPARGGPAVGWESGKKVLDELNSVFDCPKLITDWESAEMIKYASNTFLATKISFANELANLCDKYGANIKTVTEGMGLDSRIGPKFLRAGIGFGGGCFPKDVRALNQVAQDQNYDFKLIEAVMEVNHRQRLIAVEKIVGLLDGQVNDKLITVLGLSFKPETDDTRDSPGIFIIKKLLEKGAGIQAYDPAAIENSKRDLKDQQNVKIMNDALDAVKDSDLLFLATEWPEFINLNWSKVKDLMKGDLILDGRNVLDQNQLVELGFKYQGFGV